MAEVWDLQAGPGNNAAYIALMGPDVGHALAQWLDHEARQVDRFTYPDIQATVARHALAVARAITGDTT